MNEISWLALIGLFSGILLGFAARFGRFCTLGALEDIVYGGRYYRALMWVSAIGWCLIVVGTALAFGHFALEDAIYLQFRPNYFAHISGGLIFGYGMAMAGMCGFTALARSGTGDLRALFVVIFIGIFAYSASSGLLSPLRMWLFAYEPIGADEALPSLARIGGNPIIVFLCLGVTLVIAPMLRARYRQSAYPLWAFVVALGIALGWLGTYWVHTNSFALTRVESHTFSLPLGEGMLYTMISSGMALSFGIGSVFGVMLGALIAGLIKREIRWEACDDPRELRRQLLGAALMGVGAVIGFGCSIGQGLSAMAMLSFGAPITLASIVLGAYIGLRRLVEG